ncbi:MAG: hypothetical protein IJB85_13455 [Clostridia bacterium]|nr:hypothetical protein [Clostridia bacterium]
MACITAAALRRAAREAMLACGGRGFVRFPDADHALLVTDAIRRCADDAQRSALTAALEEAGFACEVREGLLYLAPQDHWLAQIDCAPARAIDWSGELHSVRALAMRWLDRERQSLTCAGRQLVLDALRLTWKDRSHVLAGLGGLRAQAAVMQRNADTSGLYEAGAVLLNWCDDEEGTEHEA